MGQRPNAGGIGVAAVAEGDDPPAVAEGGVQGSEPVTGGERVLREPQSHQAEAAGGHPAGDDLPVVVGHAEVPPPGAAERERDRRLAGDGCEDDGLDGGGQREATGEAHPDHPDARGDVGIVQAPCQRPHVLGDRAVGAPGEGGELAGDARPGEGRDGVPRGGPPAVGPEQRGDGDPEARRHEMVGEAHHLRGEPGDLRQEHHARPGAALVDLVLETGRAERGGRPVAEQVGVGWHRPIVEETVAAGTSASRHVGPAPPLSPPGHRGRIAGSGATPGSHR